MSNNKLPDGWTRVKFGDIARNVNENSRDLAADVLDRVVGLDHLDPGSLRLTRWDDHADLPDGTTFTRKFEPGQVLFGKRRAYQRKVAVPDFEGVCSGDILVFEPADERLLTEFLPYLVQSDGFFDHALGTSAGSLSPRTKWAELAKYEFALPPIDEQRRIVETLAAVEELESSYLEVRDSSHAVGSALLKRSASTSLTERVEDLVTEIRAGSTPRRSEPGYYEGTIPWLKSGEVDSGRISHTAECVTDRALAETPIWLMPVGTVVVAMYGDGKTAGSVGILETPMVCNQAVLGLVADRTRVLPDYLYWVLRRQKEALRNQRAGSSQGNLNKEIVGNFRIPVPPISDQEQLLAEVSRVEDLTQSAELAREAMKVLGASLRERLLGGFHVQ